MDIKALWEGSGTRVDDSGALMIEKPGLLRSRSKLGSGIYEIDIVCDFSRGGLVFKADPEMQRGVVAAALFTYFRPVDGNIGFWDAALQAFPLRWTLGGTLKKGHHRFRVETYGSRHAFSIVDPKSGKTLAGPLDYRIDTVEAEGLFGVKVDAGSARVTRFAFAPAGLTQAIYPTSRNIDSLVHDAFASRTRTRKFGQKAPAGYRVPQGAAAAIEFDYIKEQEKFRGDDKN